MKRYFTIIALLATFLGMSAQGIYTRQNSDKKLQKTAEKWLKKGEWRTGFLKASPDASVNAVDFYEQYQKNREQWETMFRWLQDTDLMALPKGKHPIPGSTLVASVEDSQNGPLEKRQSESHYKKIDFQWCVKGIERFGIIEHETSKPNCEYRPDVIHYDYETDKARFYDSTPDRFFIFFPSDWHIAKINNDTDDQAIRVIVVKVDYVE